MGSILRCPAWDRWFELIFTCHVRPPLNGIFLLFIFFFLKLYGAMLIGLYNFFNSVKIHFCWKSAGITFSRKKWCSMSINCINAHRHSRFPQFPHWGRFKILRLHKHIRSVKYVFTFWSLENHDSTKKKTKSLRFSVLFTFHWCNAFSSGKEKVETFFLKFVKDYFLRIGVQKMNLVCLNINIF